MTWQVGKAVGGMRSWQGEKGARLVRWQGGKGGRMVKWQGGRFPVLFKGGFSLLNKRDFMACYLTLRTFSFRKLSALVNSFSDIDG